MHRHLLRRFLGREPATTSTPSRRQPWATSQNASRRGAPRGSDAPVLIRSARAGLWSLRYDISANARG
eukprot:3073490-Lingulodinium_polyedra.AAC.1